MTYEAITQNPALLPRWTGRIVGIKDLLSDETLPDAAVVELVTKVVEVLRASKPPRLDQRARDEYTAVIEDFEAVTNEEDLNYALDRLYDFGDTERYIIA